MSSLQIPFLSFSSSQKRVRAYDAAIAVPKLQRVGISLPKNHTASTKLVQQFNGSIRTIVASQKAAISTSRTFQDCCDTNKCKAIIQLHAISVAVADRLDMHRNIGDKRNNWNSLLLNSINLMMVRLNTANIIHNSALKLTSILLLTAAKVLVLIMNKIQTSKRNATTSFKQLHTDIQTTLSHANPTEEDVNSAMERVLALDKAYPLPLTGTNKLGKFPSKLEPRTSDSQMMKVLKSQKKTNNGWTPELEMEMRQIIEVVKKKDTEGNDRLGNLALKISKTLAILGPLLAGIVAVGTALESHGSSWAGILAVTAAGSLADFINPLEAMVLEMYRNSGGFLQDTIEATLEEKDCDKRENGELFEMKVAMKLGRSVSQLKQLASKGLKMDEFACKLF